MTRKRSTSSGRRTPIKHSRRVALRRRVRASSPWHRRLVLHPFSQFMLLIIGVLIVGWTLRATAATYTVTGKVPAPPLTEGAVITSPADGFTTDTSPVTVSGTCPDSSYVTLTRNGQFSGSASCLPDHTFSIATSLSPGANTIVAQDFNTTDDPGPSTPGITVTYNPPAPPPSGGGSSSSGSSGSGGSGGTILPVLLVSDYTFHAIPSGSDFGWRLAIAGGLKPYAVLVDWGDDHSTTYARGRTGSFVITHRYSAGGYYPIIVTLTDSRGDSSLLQLAAFVKEPGAAAYSFFGSTSPTPDNTSNPLIGALLASKWLLLAWPTYATIVLMTASFWLGERQEIRRLALTPIRAGQSRRMPYRR